MSDRSDRRRPPLLMALVLAVTACGRLHFDQTARDGGPSMDALLDADAIDAAGEGPASTDASTDATTDASIDATTDASIDAGAPLFGQALTPDPTNPAWLSYDGVRPAFLCGASEPEKLFHRGTPNPDGTRTGDQQAVIDAIVGTGMNVLASIIIASHGGNGDAFANPFIDGDPALGVSDAALDQWAGWIEQLNRAGVIVLLYLYDDGACIWGCNGSVVTAEETAFLERIVPRLGAFPLILWGIAQLTDQVTINMDRVSPIAAEIRRLDPRGHPIATHTFGGLFGFAPWADDPNLDVSLFGAGATTLTTLDTRIANEWAAAAGRFNLVLEESATWTEPLLLRQWVAAMGGAYPLWSDWDLLTTPRSELEDCGRQVSFMEQTDFHRMEPRADLAFAGTYRVLAAPPDSFILYTDDFTADMGVRGLTAGTYDITWFDPQTGATTDAVETLPTDGDATLPTPGTPGQPLAAWLRRR